MTIVAHRLQYKIGTDGIQRGPADILRVLEQVLKWYGFYSNISLSLLKNYKSYHLFLLKSFWDIITVWPDIVTLILIISIKGTMHWYWSRSSASKHYIFIVTFWHIVQHVLVPHVSIILFSTKEIFPHKMVTVINAYQWLIGQIKQFIIPVKC